MSENMAKKELREQYKNRLMLGGVYAIKNLTQNKILVEATTDLEGSKNRFEFSKKTGSCVSMKLQKDWRTDGADKFVFEVLETLEKGETQTPEEFKADTLTLKQIWLEKMEGQEFY